VRQTLCDRARLGELAFAIARKSIDRDHRRQPEFVDDLEMRRQIFAARGQRLQIFALELGRQRFAARYAVAPAVRFEGTRADSTTASGCSPLARR
jgi:hypothetical protein